jgi:hypothetical protein
MIFINGVSFQSETLKNPKIFLFQKKLVIVLQSHFINQTPSFQREASVFFSSENPGHLSINFLL